MPRNLRDLASGLRIPATMDLRALRRPAFAALCLLATLPAFADQVAVRHAEGRLRGFLRLRDLSGKVLAIGELRQLADGSRVSIELRFHFNDGSLHEETTEFSQRRQFRLLSHHLVQKGPAFERQLDLAIDAPRGLVTIRYRDPDKEEETIRERMKLPADLANGMIPTLVSDLDPAREATVSLLAASPKPRVVKLHLRPDGEESFAIAGSPLSARRFKVEVEIGGLAGAVAPLVGKQPPDGHVWVASGPVPSFLRSEGPLAQDGPIWRIELASPVWAKDEEGNRASQP